MPFAKNAAGKWVVSAEAGPSDAAVRLVIVDKQVDMDGSFTASPDLINFQDSLSNSYNGQFPSSIDIHY